MKKVFTYFLQSIFVYFFFITSKIIGLRFSRYFFSKIFIFLGNFFKRKKIILQNLEKILPRSSNLEKENLIKKMWSNYGKTFIEYAHLNSFKKKSIHISIKNKKVIDQLVKKNKPAIFISGHFGNYELMSMELVKANVKLATIYRPLNNFFINPFMEYVRRTNVCKNQIKKGLGGVKDAIGFMQKNYSIALMVDQRVGEGPRISLFNKEAHTTTLPAQLSKKFNCDIIPIYIARKDDDNFEMEILDPIKTNFNVTEKNLLSLEINKVIEKLILRDPSQWILTHNRWK